jgi:probable phosphoglycerate mutase
MQGGFSDIGLNERGKQQAACLSQALWNEEIVAIYASPLSRALDTAQAIAGSHQVEVRVDDDLREIDAGDVDGLSLDELGVKYRDFWQEWRQGTGIFRMPGGASLGELQDRAWQAIERIRQGTTQGTVVVVAHTFVVLTIICRGLGLDLANIRRLRQDVGGFSILDFGQRGVSLVALNDTCHLGQEGVRQ